MTAKYPAIVQIGVVVTDLEHCISCYEKLLGWNDWSFSSVDTAKGRGRRFTFAGAPCEVRAKIAWTVQGGLELEVIQPLDENGIYAEFLLDHGPGLHHVMLQTKDYDSSMNDFRASGYEVVASGELQNSRFALVNAVQDLGMLIELAEGGPLVPDD